MSFVWDANVFTGDTLLIGTGTGVTPYRAMLPERFPGAILIAQHMPDKFTRLAPWPRAWHGTG